MAQHRSWLLLLLLLLLTTSLAYSLHSDEEGVVPAVDDDDDDDDLEDWEDLEEDDVPLETSSAPRPTFNVLSVDDETVASFISNNHFVLLLGYAPWCLGSQALLPHFAGAAAAMAEEGSPVVLAKLDAINNPNAAGRYEIRGFPSLLLFTNGSSEPYLGGNTREEIVIWLRKKTGLAATTITSKEEAESFLKKNSTAVLGYFDQFEGPEYESFIAAARAEIGTEFVQTTVAEVAQMLISPPFVAVRKPEPEHFVAFVGSFNEADISSFVELNKHPLVTLLNSANAGRVYSSPFKFHVLLFAESGDYESVKSLYLDAAKDSKGKVMFLVVDLQDEEFSQPMLSLYGLGTDKPWVAGFDNDDGSRYLMEAEVTAENLKAFAADLVAGKLSTHFKSEPVPAEDDGVVKIVVGKTFDEIVMDDTKDVFLQVYAPWCVTCDKVNNIFEKLAQHLQGVSSLVLAKYNASANEHPLLQDFPSYPALLLYPAGKKKFPASAFSHTSIKKLLLFVKDNVAIPISTLEDGKILPGAKGKKEAVEVEVPILEKPDIYLDSRKDTEAPVGSPLLTKEKELELALRSSEGAREATLATPQSQANVESYTGQSEPKDEL